MISFHSCLFWTRECVEWEFVCEQELIRKGDTIKAVGVELMCFPSQEAEVQEKRRQGVSFGEVELGVTSIPFDYEPLSPHDLKLTQIARMADAGLLLMASVWMERC